MYPLGYAPSNTLEYTRKKRKESPRSGCCRYNVEQNRDNKARNCQNVKQFHDG